MRQKQLKTILALSAVCAMGVAGEVLSKATFITGGDSLPFEGKKENAVMSVDFSCPAGQDFYMGECKAKCDEKLYPFADTPDESIGHAGICESVFGNRYIYTSCYDGWTLADGKCIADACEGFDLIDEPSEIVGTFESCKAGHIMKYKYTDCHEGWKLINGDCVIKSCDSTVFPYKSKPSDTAGTVIQCQSGVTTVYGYKDPCHEGWTFKDGQCVMNTCDSNVYPFDKEPDKTKGTVISCQTGEKIKYGYSDCVEGYTLNNGKCEEPCKFFITWENRMDLPTKYNCATGRAAYSFYYHESCIKDGVKYVGCKYCYPYFSLDPSGNGTCFYDPCSKSTEKTCPAHAQCTKCKNGYYGIESCDEGYVLKKTEHKCVRDCKLGDYFYADYSCSKTLDKNKTVIGVVIYPNRQLIMGLDKDVMLPYNSENLCSDILMFPSESSTYTMGIYRDKPQNKSVTCKDTSDGEFFSGINFSAPFECNSYAASFNRAGEDLRICLNSGEKQGISRTEALEKCSFKAAAYCALKTDGGLEWYLPRDVDLTYANDCHAHTGGWTGCEVKRSLTKLGIISSIHTSFSRSYFWYGNCQAREDGASQYTRTDKVRRVSCIASYKDLSY